MNELYVIGGQQRAARSLLAANQDWNGYQKGIILRVDPQSGSAEISADYVSPPEVIAAEDPAITFQASTIVDNKLYTCTQTEVMIYQLPTFERLAYISLPCFNDVHHVRPTPEGNLLVANAGLEMVLEMTTTGEILREWNVLGEDPWGRFSRDIDYRPLNTKPHRSHPNYLFYLNDEIWVTRFHQGDALCLTQPDKRIQISNKRIHDGVVYNNRIYFTTVDGTVVVANPDTMQVEKVFDLNSMSADGTLLGWCRSLLIEDGQMWVGFSRIRPTKLRENVSWLARGFKRDLPTHVACYDTNTERLVKEIDLEAAGLGAVYSIFAAPR